MGREEGFGVTFLGSFAKALASLSPAVTHSISGLLIPCWPC